MKTDFYILGLCLAVSIGYSIGITIALFRQKISDNICYTLTDEEIDRLDWNEDWENEGEEWKRGEKPYGEAW